jgi:octaprenyl-diphosphate synthase
MPIPLEGAVASLSDAAAARGVEEEFDRHAEEVRELLADDLAFIENALEAVSGGCAEPADAAARHLISRGGKRVRPVALLLSSACFGPIPPAARELATVAELVHSATLLHDDVIDEGMERRGAATSRRLWGNGISVLAGDLLLVHSIERTLRIVPAALPELIETLRELVEGEVVQMRGRTELDVSEKTYQRVLRGKTASLFVWATRMGAMTGGANAEEQAALADFGGELGMAFQLVDDVLDYVGEDSGKTLLADLGEGKLTLPLVLALERVPRLLGAVRRIHAGDRGPVGEVSRVVGESGACDEVRRRAAEHTRRGVKALERIGDSPARRLLQSVAEQLVQRAR